MLTEFQKAKLIEWAEWCQTYDGGDMPCGLRLVEEWLYVFGAEGPFPTREQFAERQNAVTSEAI